MELYIIIKRNPKINVWGVAYMGKVFTDYKEAELALSNYRKQLPCQEAKIIVFNVDKEY